MGIVKKECPICKHPESDIHFAEIITDAKGTETSYNKYTCVKCKVGFLVQRKGNKAEQALTEKYIKSEPIKLKK